MISNHFGQWRSDGRLYGSRLAELFTIEQAKKSAAWVVRRFLDGDQKKGDIGDRERVAIQRLMRFANRPLNQ